MNRNRHFHPELLTQSRTFKHRNWELNAGNEQSLREFWTDASGHKIAEQFSVLANAPFLEDKNVLHTHNFSFHTGNLSQADDFAGSVAEAAYLHNYVNGRRNLPPNGGVGDAQIR